MAMLFFLGALIPKPLRNFRLVLDLRSKIQIWNVEKLDVLKNWENAQNNELLGRWFRIFYHNFDTTSIWALESAYPLIYMKFGELIWFDKSIAFKFVTIHGLSTRSSWTLITEK